MKIALLFVNDYIYCSYLCSCGLVILQKMMEIRFQFIFYLLGMVGLHNFGSTCWLNSTLQAFFHVLPESLITSRSKFTGINKVF